MHGGVSVASVFRLRELSVVINNVNSCDRLFSEVLHTLEQAEINLARRRIHVGMLSSS